MTEKRFIPIFDGIDKRVVGAKDNGAIISFEDMFNLLNELNEENTQLKQEKKSKRKTRLVHQHIIKINYPYGTDVEDTEYMIKHIKSVITRETGVEPTIEEYLL